MILRVSAGSENDSLAASRTIRQALAPVSLHRCLTQFATQGVGEATAAAPGDAFSLIQAPEPTTSTCGSRRASGAHLSASRWNRAGSSWMDLGGARQWRRRNILLAMDLARTLGGMNRTRISRPVERSSVRGARARRQPLWPLGPGGPMCRHAGVGHIALHAWHRLCLRLCGNHAGGSRVLG